MDEPTAPRVDAPAAEPAERGDAEQPRLTLARDRRRYSISVRLRTKGVPEHVKDDLLDALSRRGYTVDSIQVRDDQRPLAQFQRPREPRRW